MVCGGAENVAEQEAGLRRLRVIRSRCRRSHACSGETSDPPG